MENLQNGIREVIFVHERGHEMLMIKEQWNRNEINQMDLVFGGTGVAKLKLVETPVFKSYNGDWTFEEMDILANLVVFDERCKIRTRTGKESFKNEALAVYDTLRGMHHMGSSKERAIGRVIFQKMFPKLSYENVIAKL
jgi:hypothetical protein